VAGLPPRERAEQRPLQIHVPLRARLRGDNEVKATSEKVQQHSTLPAFPARV